MSKTSTTTTGGVVYISVERRVIVEAETLVYSVLINRILCEPRVVAYFTLMRKLFLVGVS